MLYQGYSNRSTILFRAGEFVLCAEDVDAALDCSDKQDKEFILMDRKAKCLMKDGARRKEARDGIQSNWKLGKRLIAEFTSQAKNEIKRFDYVEFTPQNRL